MIPKNSLDYEEGVDYYYSDYTDEEYYCPEERTEHEIKADIWLHTCSLCGSFCKWCQYCKRCSK